MKHTEKLRKKSYTLVEILAAMGVFMIISLVVMRFFNGAQEVVVVSTNNNEMHANVRAFFDIIGNDLRSIVYNNQVGRDGIKPFINGYYPISNPGSPFDNTNYFKNIGKFYAESFIPQRFQTDIVFKNDWRDYVPLLCFMANPSIIPSDATSPLCEIRYTFTPVGTNDNDKAEFGSRKKEKPTYGSQTTLFSGGKILRSVTYADPGKTTSGTHPFNAEEFPLVDATGAAVPASKDRIKAVFGDDSSFEFEELIGNVYRMNISCYKLELTSGKIYQYRKLEMFDLGTSVRKEFSDDYAAYMFWPPYIDPTDTGTGMLYKYPVDGTDIELPQLGHPLPDLIKVDLYMLSPRDWSRLMSYYDWDGNTFTDEVAAKKLLDRKLRQFSRNFYINSVDVSNL